MCGNTFVLAIISISVKQLGLLYSFYPISEAAAHSLPREDCNISTVLLAVQKLFKAYTSVQTSYVLLSLHKRALNQNGILSNSEVILR